MKRIVLFIIVILTYQLLFAQRPGFYIWKNGVRTHIYTADQVDSILFYDDIPAIFDNVHYVSSTFDYFTSMNKRYLGRQGMSGEGCVKIWYGNYQGNDYQKCGMGGYSSEWESLINQKYQTETSSVYNYFLWYYYYSVINSGYIFLSDLEKGWNIPDVDKYNYKVQVLITRAYCYMMLAQLYCERWVDSNDGSSRGLPLIKDSCPINETFEKTFVSLREVYDEIYKLVDETLEMMNGSLYDEETYKISPIIYKSGYDYSSVNPGRSAAYATKARAALNRQDWDTAAKCAALAKNGHPLMDNDKYINGGFSQTTSETIWSLEGGLHNQLYYYSFFAYQGSNSRSSSCRRYPAAISKELIDKIPETDIRKKMYLIPSDEELKECNEAGKSMRKLYLRAYRDYYAKLDQESEIYAYMQFKFQENHSGIYGGVGTGNVEVFRSAEMYLIEAEADYYLGKFEEARSLLNQLNKERDPEYNCIKIGEELLEEIRLYRRFELWGEGFDWFDMKRWKLPIVRHSYSEGGSFYESFAVTIQPNDANNWVWVVPKDYKE